MKIRKIITIVEEVYIEGGKKVDPPKKMAASIAVISNPLAGKGFVQDIKEIPHTYSEKLAAMLSSNAVKAIGVKPEQIECYGKGVLVGLDGEIEHGSAIVHTMKWGLPFRKEVGGGETLMPAAEKRGAAGATLDIPLKHKMNEKIRSHHQTFEVRVPDAPRPDEIVVVAAVSDSGRPHPRIGELGKDL